MQQIRNGFRKLFPRSWVAGLDVGATHLKLIVLSRVGSQYRLEHYAAVALLPGTIQDNEITDKPTFVSAVHRLLIGLRSPLKKVVIALPDNMVISKTLSINAALSHAELAEFIQFHAEQQLACSLNDVNLDFQIIGANQKNSALNDVLVVAAHQDKIMARVSAIAAGGLTVDIVTVASHAIERACLETATLWPDQGINKMVALLMIDGATLTLMVLANREVIFTRMENFGLLNLTESIQNHYQLTYEAAEFARANNSLPADYQDTILAPFNAKVINQLQHALPFFFATVQGAALDYLVLAGAGAGLAGLAASITAETKLSVILADPLHALQIAPAVAVNSLPPITAGLLLSVGLALQGLG